MAYEVKDLMNLYTAPSREKNDSEIETIKKPFYSHYYYPIELLVGCFPVESAYDDDRKKNPMFLGDFNIIGCCDF